MSDTLLRKYLTYDLRVSFPQFKDPCGGAHLPSSGGGWLGGRGGLVICCLCMELLPDCVMGP